MRGPLLDEYFAEGRYRFQMQFGRGSFADFYGATSQRTEILDERRHWLASATKQHLILTPEAEPILQEVWGLAGQTIPLPTSTYQPANSQEMATCLGQNLEPDYLLLTRDLDSIRLVGGCVCFPSSWILEEKIGRPIEEIHEIVPGLNPAIGRQIQTFLQKIQPDVSWTRSNWGLSRSSERNQHPSRKLPRLDADVTIDQVFFRIEEQSLIALPGSHGILFGIRIRIYPLRDFIGTTAAQKLLLALETMPEPMALYKGVAAARTRIIQMLCEKPEAVSSHTRRKQITGDNQIHGVKNKTKLAP